MPDTVGRDHNGERGPVPGQWRAHDWRVCQIITDLADHYRTRRALRGYDRRRLTLCLAGRGIVVSRHDIVGVSHDSCVHFRDGSGIWVLPSWIEDARRPRGGTR